MHKLAGILERLIGLYHLI